MDRYFEANGFQGEADCELFSYHTYKIGQFLGHAAAEQAIEGERDRKQYAQHLISSSKGSFQGYKVGLDCANGNASKLAPYIFETLGAEVHAINVQFDGTDNDIGCGSTNIGALCDYVRENGLDLGFAYDRDAKRCLAADAQGNYVDGDQIMYLCAMHMKEQGRLTNNTVVTTFMSNYGLYKAFDEQGIAYETVVAAKHVYENMAANGYALGGDPSGLIIFRELANTSDGILTSLMIMEVVTTSGKTLGELVAPVEIYPFLLANVDVNDKTAVREDADVKHAIESASAALEGEGRILVRPRKTGSVICIMTEASSAEACEQYVNGIIDVMKIKGHVAAREIISF